MTTNCWYLKRKDKRMSETIELSINERNKRARTAKTVETVRPLVSRIRQEAEELSELVHLASRSVNEITVSHGVLDELGVPVSDDADLGETSVLDLDATLIGV